VEFSVKDEQEIYVSFILTMAPVFLKNRYLLGPCVKIIKETFSVHPLIKKHVF